MIIGLTGRDAAGKDTVAEILRSMNFYIVHFSEPLREELKKKKGKVSKDELIKLGNKWREIKGPDVLARVALTKVQDGENHVLISLRNSSEVRLLQQRKDFLLVNVIAPEKIRLQRYLKQGRDSDPKTIHELRAIEKLEDNDQAFKLQMNKVAKMAKITIVNDSTEEKLKEKVQRLVEDWLYKLQDSRPDWDHYFMEIAEAVKMRCNCMSAKKGAIIVKDKQIISTGYNGTPRGITHCNEGGCKRCTSRHLGRIKSGVYSEPCICAHAEENAIVQAAHNGSSIKGATLYTTFTPCTTCSKMIINAGIIEVVAKVEYPDDVGTGMLKQAGVKLRVLK